MIAHGVGHATAEGRSAGNRALLVVALTALVAVACGGGRPSLPGDGALPSSVLADLPTATTGPAGTLPAVTEAPATASSSTTPTSSPLVVPTQATTPSVRLTGSLTVKMTAPVELDVTVPADVNCSVGSSYHMDTGVTIDDYGFVVVVDIPRYHGADSYRAAVTLEVTVDGDEEGGAVPGVPVTIKSDSKGFVEYSYTGSSTTVSGKITWVCST